MTRSSSRRLSPTEAVPFGTGLLAQEVRNLMQGEAVYPVSDRYAAGFPANLGEVVESDTEAGGEV